MEFDWIRNENNDHLVISVAPCKKRVLARILKGEILTRARFFAPVDPNLNEI